MRKLYNHNKGKIHPSPPPPPSNTTTTTIDHLSLLPLAVATLAAALAPEDQEVLAYLLSCTTTTNKKLYDNNTKTGNHAPKFNCYCFSCYTSYWARWDASPRRHLIHEVIDTYEDKYAITNNSNNNNKRNGKNKNKKKNNKVSPSSSSPHVRETASHVRQLVEETRINNSDCVEDEDGLIVGTLSGEKGSIKSFVSFIGERIWGVWGI
ncbi:hypothetical protein Hdeb2414_s0001g00040731 [Helianthus debilis subsp. tardiflorus]